MSDPKNSKKVFGRGRGKPKRPEGPWARSKKLDECQDVRPPKKDNEEFVLNESSFPPLPGADSNDDQFLDNVEGTTETSQLNGSVTSDKTETPLKLEQTPNKTDNHHKEDETEYHQISEQTPKKTDNHHKEVDITNSNLSPLAPEFVPRPVNMNPEAQDFVPTNGNYDETNNNRSIMSNFNVNDTAAILADLEETVNFCYSKLMETPASYDELMGVVTPHFIKYMENPDLPHEIVQTLYSYAVQDTRFAYFAVKILIHLIKMTDTEGNAQLRTILLRHAQEEVLSIQNIRLTNPNTQNDVQPFLMFLSELYIQLEVGDRRLALVGGALVETLKKLLLSTHIAIKERLKLTVNILKLIGLSLDQDNSMFLDDLFAELDIIVKQESSNLDSPTIQFVNDIILLRNLNWGLVEPNQEEYLPINSDLSMSSEGNHEFVQGDYGPAIDPNMGYSSGVFYGPDGNPMDYEEQLFLEVETNALNHLQIADQGEPSPTSVEGFDEAYEEFLKTVPPQTRSSH